MTHPSSMKKEDLISIKEIPSTPNRRPTWKWVKPGIQRVINTNIRWLSGIDIWILRLYLVIILLLIAVILLFVQIYAPLAHPKTEMRIPAVLCAVVAVVVTFPVTISLIVSQQAP